MLAAFHPCVSARLVGYKRRRPKETLLYRTVQQHFGPFEAAVPTTWAARILRKT